MASPASRAGWMVSPPRTAEGRPIASAAGASSCSSARQSPAWTSRAASKVAKAIRLKLYPSRIHSSGRRRSGPRAQRPGEPRLVQPWVRTRGKVYERAKAAFLLRRMVVSDITQPVAQEGVAEALERGVAVGARRVPQTQRGEHRQHLRLVEPVEIGSEIRIGQGLDNRLLGRPPVEQPPLGQPAVAKVQYVE